MTAARSQLRATTNCHVGVKLSQCLPIFSACTLHFVLQISQSYFAVVNEAICQSVREVQNELIQLATSVTFYSVFQKFKQVFAQAAQNLSFGVLSLFQARGREKGVNIYVIAVQQGGLRTCLYFTSRSTERNIFLLLLLLAFTTHLRVLASSFLRFRYHTQ